MGINRVNLVGRLGRDPEFHYIEKNTAISRLRLAVSDGYDANGNKGQHTLWVNVVLWNRLAFVGKTDCAREQPSQWKASCPIAATWTKKE